jgi:hypothetical protein
MTMTPTKIKALLVAIGSGLVTAAPFLPMPWAALAFIVGGALGGSALVRRPGDVRVVDVGKVPLPKVPR